MYLKSHCKIRRREKAGMFLFFMAVADKNAFITGPAIAFFAVSIETSAVAAELVGTIVKSFSKGTDFLGVRCRRIYFEIVDGLRPSSRAIVLKGDLSLKSCAMVFVHLKVNVYVFSFSKTVY